MNIEATKERIQKLLNGLQDCGISDAVLVFEMKTSDGIKPHILKVGSPMACAKMSDWASSYQNEEVFEGLEVSVWYDEDEEDEV